MLIRNTLAIFAIIMASKKEIPVHHAYAMADSGLRLRTISPEAHSHKPVDYIHIDDYYMFGVVETGCIRAEVDFKTEDVHGGSALVLTPGQVHRFISSENLNAMILFADSRYVPHDLRQKFDEAAIHGFDIELSTEAKTELKQIYNILYRHIESACVAPGLARAFIGIIADAIVSEGQRQQNYSPRQLELFLKFRQCLHDNMRHSHSPTYYADRLSISLVYLNEISNRIAGCSIRSYIRQTLLLFAAHAGTHQAECQRNCAQPWIRRLFIFLTLFSVVGGYYAVGL